MQVHYQYEPEFGFRYAIRTPQKQEKGLPIIFQLHGSGERGSQRWELPNVEVHGFSHVLTEKREEACILVEPQCSENTFWVAIIPQLLNFIQKMIAKYRCDQNRVYLTGLSMGGYGTWYTAMACPELFAAIAPCCGGGMPWNAKVLKMPIWAFHGAMDEAVAVTESVNMVKAVQRSGGQVKLTIYGDCGHDVWNKAYDEKLLQWLLSQQKKTQS